MPTLRMTLQFVHWPNTFAGVRMSSENPTTTQSSDSHSLDSVKSLPPFADPSSLRMAAYAIVVIAGSWWMLGQLKIVLRPFLLAVFIAYVLMPYYMRLRKKVPGAIAVAFMAGLTTIVLMTVALMVVSGLQELEQDGPKLRQNAVELIRGVERWMTAHLPASVSRNFTGPGSFDELVADRGTNIAMELMNLAALGLVEAATTGLYLLFLLMESARFPRRVRSAFASERADHILHEFGRINAAIIGFVKGKVVSSLVLAVPVGIILVAGGVRFALLWAVLTFACNFIPYIGSIIAYTIPVGFAFLQLDAGWVPFAVAVLLLGCHITSASVVEPMILGNAVGLSPLVILGALSVWGLLWGLPGMFLAVPLTVVTVLVLENFDVTRPVAKLLSS